MKPLVFLLLLCFSSWAFAAFSAVVPHSVPVSIGPYDWVGGVAVDDREQAFIAVNRTETDEIEIRSAALSASDSTLITRISARDLGGGKRDQWKNFGLALNENNELFGLFQQTLGSIESVIAAVPTTPSGRVRVLYRSGADYSGFAYHNGYFFTFNGGKKLFSLKNLFAVGADTDRHNHLTKINASAPILRSHVTHPQLKEISAFSISPSGTLVAVQSDSDGQSIRIFRMVGDKLEFIQSMPYGRIHPNYYSEYAHSVTARDDAFFLGTTLGSIDAFQRQSNGLFEQQPSQTVSLGRGPQGNSNIVFAMGSSLRSIAFSTQDDQTALASLPVQASGTAIAAAPEIVPSTAQKLAAVSEQIRDHRPTVDAVSLKIAFAVQVRFDRALAQKIRTQFPETTPFKVLAENARVFINEQALLLGQEVVFEDPFIVFPVSNPHYEETGSQQLLVKAKIPRFLGEGITIKIADPSSVLQYDRVVTVELVEEETA